MRIAILLLSAIALSQAAAPKAAVAPKSAVASDATIEAAIRAKFAKSKISEDQFRVSVRSGVAHLEGKTDVPQRKGVATRLAKNAGAREVVNKIEVSEAARKKLTERLQQARAARIRSGRPAQRAAASTPTPVPAAAARPEAASSLAASPVARAAVPAAAPAKAHTAAPAPVSASVDPPLRRMQIKR